MSQREIEKTRVRQLRFVSSGSKIINQLVIFIIVGILPLIFPNKISFPNQTALFFILYFALTTSLIFEYWRNLLEKSNKDTKKIMVLQLITSVVLLTLFLHLFSRINGPLFILYLLTVMESALNLNVGFPNIVVGIMLLSTFSEFVYLVKTGEMILNFTAGIEFVIRLVSLVFMRSYGMTLAKTIIEEQDEKIKTIQLANDLQISAKKLRQKNLNLASAYAKLKELDRMKDEFVSIASHELRTPMTSINSYLWMVLNKKGGEINPKQKFYLERAAISTQRSINLVNDMLTVSRIEGGKLGVNLVEGDILALAQTITDELQTKAKEKKVKLFLESPSIELPLVVLDSEKIREVLNNLIGNAIKFTDPQGQVVVSFKKKGNFVFTFITDTGRGIAKNDIPKLFKKFGRLDRSFATVAETGGTGLGLYISKQIIDLHHGKIGVESKPTKGSTFYFSLKEARGK